MPKSLRCKIKHLCYKGTLTEKERDRLLKALEYEDALDEMREEILHAEPDELPNEEAKKAEKELNALLNMCNPSPLTKELEDALKLAMKALEQQPCEDAVSRTLVHEAITASIAESENPYEMWQRIETLPSVTPQRPKGKWIEIEIDAGEFIYKCTKCGMRVINPYKYCPNCGAEMSGGGEDETDN